MRATVGLGVQWFLVIAGLVLVAAFGVVVLVTGTSRHQIAGVLLGALIVVLAVAGLFLASAVWSAVGAYLRAMLYRYATGQPIPGIDPGCSLPCSRWPHAHLATTRSATPQGYGGPPSGAGFQGW